MLRVASEVGSQLATLLLNPEYHDEQQSPSVGVIIEHTRKHIDRMGTPAEDGIITLISGSTNLDENVPPNLFGPHLDFSHSSPAFIMFAADHTGTIACTGEYAYLEATRSQQELNVAGNGLARVQLEAQRLYFGDVRTLLHEAPNTGDAKWRNFIRMFVGPRHPEQP
jgi:hypothetical protein